MHLDAAEQARLATALRQLESTATVDLSQEETLHAVVGDCNVSFFGRPGTWLSEPVPVSEGFGLATAEEIAAMKLIAIFSDAELDPEPIVLDQTTWDTVKRGAERLATELRRHLLSMK